MSLQVAAIQAEVTKQQKDSEKDLAKAEPALQAANAALNTLNRVRVCLCPCPCVCPCVCKRERDKCDKGEKCIEYTVCACVLAA